MGVTALNLAGWALAVAALAVSARYFLSSKPADDGPVDHSRLLFGRVHPQMLFKFVIGVAVAYSCWALSSSLAVRGDRILAGLTLAAGVPAALFVVITTFAATLTLAAPPSASAPPLPQSPQSRMRKARIATWIVFVVLLLAVGLFRVFW